MNSGGRDGLLNLAFLEGHAARAFFNDILHHGTKVRRERVEVVWGRASPKGGSLTVPGGLVACEARKGGGAGLENGCIGGKVRHALASRNRDRSSATEWVVHVSRLDRRGSGFEVGDDALQRLKHITVSVGRRSGHIGRGARRLPAAALPGDTLPVVAASLGRFATASTAAIAIALRLRALLLGLLTPDIVTLLGFGARVISGRVRWIPSVTRAGRGPLRTTAGRARARHVPLGTSVAPLPTVGSLLFLSSLVLLLGCTGLCVRRDFVSHFVRDEYSGCTRIVICDL